MIYKYNVRIFPTVLYITEIMSVLRKILPYAIIVTWIKQQKKYHNYINIYIFGLESLYTCKLSR